MSRILLATALFVSLATPVALFSLAAQDDAATGAPSLATIKALAGRWVAAGEDGGATDQVVSEFRVTAGGSAVIETLFPGTEHEMITMYTQDGGDLVATHYCVLGNQPRFRARWEQSGGELVFECVGVGNLRAHTGEHMHEGRLLVQGSDRLRATWTASAEGKPGHRAEFALVRAAAGED